MGDTTEFRNHPNVNEHLEGEGRNNHWENSYILTDGIYQYL